MASAETPSEPFSIHMGQRSSRWLQFSQGPSGQTAQRSKGLRALNRQFGSPMTQPCRHGVASEGRTWGLTIKATDAMT